MKKRAIYYSSAVAAPLLALGLIAAPAFAQGTAQASPRADVVRPELTDEQKSTLEQVHELFKQGKRDEARALLESAGLPAHPVMARPHGPRPEMREQHEAVHQAVLDGDYAKFQELTKDAPFASDIDEATFRILSEAAKLREAGDKDGAKALLDEAGIKPPHPRMHSGQRFFKGFRNAR